MDWDDICIYTNIFLDFYQAAIDRLALFQELVRRANRVVLTEQTIIEFRRNRTARLSELARNVEKTSDIQIYTYSLIREISEFDEWVKAKDAAKGHVKAIVKRLRFLIQDESSDPVYQEFMKLVSAATTFRTTSEAIERAVTRKQLGNPPTSPDKHTIGDELVWETLLEHCDHNLLIVSRDKTYRDNIGLLREEFERAGQRKLLLITEHLTDALKRAGEPFRQVAAAERQMQLVPQSDSAELESDHCPKCGEQMELNGDYYDFKGDDSPDMCEYWLYCPNCEESNCKELHDDGASSEEEVERNPYQG